MVMGIDESAGRGMVEQDRRGGAGQGIRPEDQYRDRILWLRRLLEKDAFSPLSRRSTYTMPNGG